jgi:hypothetical protein
VPELNPLLKIRLITPREAWAQSMLLHVVGPDSVHMLQPVLDADEPSLAWPSRMRHRLIQTAVVDVLELVRLRWSQKDRPAELDTITQQCRHEPAKWGVLNNVHGLLKTFATWCDRYADSPGLSIVDGAVHAIDELCPELYPDLWGSPRCAAAGAWRIPVCVHWFRRALGFREDAAMKYGVDVALHAMREA